VAAGPAPSRGVVAVGGDLWRRIVGPGGSVAALAGALVPGLGPGPGPSPIELDEAGAEAGAAGAGAGAKAGAGATSPGAASSAEPSAVVASACGALGRLRVDPHWGLGRGGVWIVKPAGLS